MTMIQTLPSPVAGSVAAGGDGGICVGGFARD